MSVKNPVDDIFERIKKTLNVGQVSKALEKLDLKRGTYDNWRARKEIPAQRLYEIASKIGTTKEWLETGVGISQGEQGRNIIGDRNSVGGMALDVPLRGMDDEESSVTVPYYPEVYASAGGGAVISDLEGSVPLTFSRKFLDVYFKIAADKRVDLINVVGNSMSPTFDDGDMVFVRRLNGEDVISGKVYVFIYENEMFIKRAKKNPIAKTITLVSDNKEDDDIPLTREETENIRAIGMVIGSMGRV